MITVNRLSHVAMPTPMATAPPPRPGADVGSTFALGGGHGFLSGIAGKLKNAMLYAALGAAAGMVFPIIPGGPVGGALIGAAISLLF